MSFGAGTFNIGTTSCNGTSGYSAWRAPAEDRFSAENTGVAAVEFAIYGTLFLINFAATVDIGLVMYIQFQVNSAVSAGAPYAAINAASINSTSAASLAISISNVVANANGSGWEDGTVVVNNGPTVTVTGGSAVVSGTAANADNCYCPTGSPPNWSWGSSRTCGSALHRKRHCRQVRHDHGEPKHHAAFPQLWFCPKRHDQSERAGRDAMKLPLLRKLICSRAGQRRSNSRYWRRYFWRFSSA